MSGRALASAVLAAIVLVAVAVVALGMPAVSAVRLAGIAAGAALTAGAAGYLVLRYLRGARLATYLTVVVLTSVGAVVVGALAAVNAMFLSAEDSRALVVIVLAAAAVGLAAALMLARRIDDASAAVQDSARRLGDGQPPETGVAIGIREFAELARALEAAAARLDEARRRESAADVARRELVAWVSHDLRTPLAGIMAITEALEDGVVTDAPTVARYHATLRAETVRLAGLVDDLFELSRITAGSLGLEPARVDLGDLVSDAIAAADPRAAAQGVILTGSVDRPGPVIEVDTPAFARVLDNLLANAIRETAAGGAVTVQAGLHDGEAYVAVQDECGGIPGDVMARMF